MKESGRELIWLAALFFACGALWWAFTPWSFHHVLASGDTLFSLSWVSDALVANGNWDQLLYRSDILGGAAFSDSLERQPLLQWFSYLKKDAVVFVNFQVLLIQVLIGYFSMQSLRAGTRIFFNVSEELSRGVLLFCALFFAFHPVVLARIAAGHLNLLWGWLSFISLFSLLLQELEGRSRPVFLVVTWLTLVNAGLSSGHQMNLYTLVFGGLVFLGLTWQFQKIPWRLLIFASSAFFFILPEFASLYRYSQSADAVRQLGMSSLGGRLETFSLADFLKNLFYSSSNNILSGRQGYLHEIFYSMGLTVPFAAMFLWEQRWRRKFLGLSLVALLSMALFSLGATDFFTTIFPPLASFRLSSRVLMIAVYFIGFCALTYLLSAKEQTKSDFGLITFSILLVFFSLPEGVSDTFLWAGALLLIFFKEVCKKEPLKKISLVFILLVVFGASAKNWPREFYHRSDVFDRPAQISKEMRNENLQPFLPLERTHVQKENQILNVNTGVALSLSTISGYWQPTYRFLKTTSDLVGTGFDSTSVFFRFDERDEVFEVFRQLYNIGYILKGREFKKLGETNGVAWFSDEILVSKEPQKKLLENKGNLKSFLRKYQLVEKQGVQSSNDCQEATVVKQWKKNSRDFSKVVDLQVETNSRCPLTIATNYVENLEGELDGEKLEIYPSYGVLAGVVVPKSGRLVLRPRSRSLKGLAKTACYATSFLLFLASMVLCFRGQLFGRNQGFG